MVPPVTSGQRGQAGILALTLLEALDGLVNGLQATQIDGLTRVILGSSGFGGSLGIGHLAIEVGHGHEAISLDQIACTGKLPVLGSLGLGDHVGHVGISADEPPLINGSYLAINGMPVGCLHVGTAIAGAAGPVTHGHRGAPGTKLQATVGIELNVGQSLVIGRGLGRRTIGVNVHVEPVVARGERQHRNTQAAQYN